MRLPQAISDKKRFTCASEPSDFPSQKRATKGEALGSSVSTREITTCGGRKYRRAICWTHQKPSQRACNNLVINLLRISNRMGTSPANWQNMNASIDNHDWLTCHAAEPFREKGTFLQRVPQLIKLVRRIIIAWVAGSPFHPKIHSAVPFYRRVPSSHARRRIIRRHRLY